MKYVAHLPAGLLCIALLAGGSPLAGGPGLMAQSRADCLACHGDSSLTKERDGKSVSLLVTESVLNRSPHKKLVCIACHTGFDPGAVPHKDPITPVKCLTCHSDAGAKHAFHPQLGAALAARQEPDVGCKDCHGTHDVVSPKVPGSKFSSQKLSASCGECHEDVREEFSRSAHGMAQASGLQGAPTCISCHRNHITIDGAIGDSLAIAKVHQEKLCLSCHLDNPDVRARTTPSAKFIAAYEKSVHGSALLKGNGKAANCVDCHGSHQMKKGFEPSAKVNKAHISETCSQCHAAIAGEFSRSVHGVALAAGNPDVPTCTNCHGEHTIFKHDDPRSPVASRNVSQQVCSPCHSSVALSSKYGLASDRFKTFSDSYHGLAARGGSVEAANCASCHGAHNIRPATDSTSMVYKANLAATCGKCHPGANERFGIGAVHVSLTAKSDEPVLYWIASAYIVLILVTIGGMLVHNLLDFFRKSKRKLMIRRGLIRHEAFGQGLYLRMTRNERVQHGILLVSFATLVVTGFMLRFPDAWWVQGIRHLSDNVFGARSVVHRVAGGAMVGASLYHLLYVALTARGRALLKDLLPGIQDARDVVAAMKYYLGLSAARPQFGRFSYVEKSEYWALVWGTFIMAATGVIMWFDNTFIGLLTKLGYDVARTIHYYEAWLATLAIVVWHLYFVIFNPDVYPINLAFWKGSLTEEEMADEHPLELARIKEIEIEELTVGRVRQAPDAPKAGNTAEPLNVTEADK